MKFLVEFFVLSSFLTILLSGCMNDPISERSNKTDKPNYIYKDGLKETNKSPKSQTNNPFDINSPVTFDPIVTPVIPEKLSTSKTRNKAFKDIWERLRYGFRINPFTSEQYMIKRFEKWYQERPNYLKLLGKRAYWFLPYILVEVEKRDMPTEIAILPIIESNFRPDATSSSRAVGLWQFIDETGQRFGLRQDWWMDERRDLTQSTRAALDYLDYLSKEFNGDWELVLAAYNAGEGTIKRAVKKNQKINQPLNYSALSLSQETSEYVPKLLALRNIIKNPAKYGIELPPIPNRLTLKVIDFDQQIDLDSVAEIGSIPIKKMIFLNMGYKRAITPPSGPHKLVIPADVANRIKKKLHHRYKQRPRWIIHVVQQGEYLKKIATRYKVTVKSIKILNHLTSNLIYPKQKLNIPLSINRYHRMQKNSQIYHTVDKRKETIYIVKNGDSLWRISEKFNIHVSKLMTWNNISKNTLIYPGQQIIVQYR